MENRECGENPQRAQRCKAEVATNATGLFREGAAIK